MMAVKCEIPNMPRLETVKDPPCKTRCDQIESFTER